MFIFLFIYVIIRKAYKLEYLINILQEYGSGLFMNTNYLISYVNLDGKEYIRTGLRKITVVIFAGFKFLFDRIFAAIGLVLLAPLFMLITLIIKLDSKGPALFTQVRTGKGGKNIKIYKI